MSTQVVAFLTIGTVVGVILGMTTIIATLRRVVRDGPQAQSPARRPARVSVRVTYADGHVSDIDVKPVDPAVAEDALRDLESA